MKEGGGQGCINLIVKQKNDYLTHFPVIRKSIKLFFYFKFAFYEVIFDELKVNNILYQDMIFQFRTEMRNRFCSSFISTKVNFNMRNNKTNKINQPTSVPVRHFSKALFKNEKCTLPFSQNINFALCIFFFLCCLLFSLHSRKSMWTNRKLNYVCLYFTCVAPYSPHTSQEQVQQLHLKNDSFLHS